MTARRSRKERAKITVLLDPVLANRFERYCADRGFKKSTLIARLVKEHVDSEGVTPAEKPRS